ncbi:restriction endonuclease subunit S [Enterobacter roggenkampii]|uniref:restriction endonuclease subunit S n=1 Tax=Enterobacter roggenkampii TaxID=1812935 RepID=UPI0027EEEE92|nr:restriction endonuclease subunit S [Enterobacter roggenkampii]HDS3777991.1 restriction endonuclease subunit S [Enterobacter roggenkampii]HDT2144751.1 restriction endonuclease subunit S [Enterobacter roggenkampii]HDT2146685.1 restriction endonuclease subunit S [Enterobacter roggenkampii]
MSFDILDNLSIKLIDGDRGKNYPKQSDFFDKSDCLFLSAKNVTKAGFEFTDCSFISKEKDQQLRAGKLERNDIVLTTRGTIGNSALYDSSVSISSVRINSGMIILRPDTNIWNPRFLYFLLNSDFLLQQISALTSGSAVPQLPARDLKKFILPRVSLDKQHKIVEIIGSIVDKIRVSKTINQTLEQMAQALFKSWFVDFEPVKAKIAVLEAGGSQADATLAAMTAISGKDADALAVFEREHPEQYAELKATAELFPSAMQESELGEIPEGWRTENVENIINRLKVKNTFPADCIKQFGQHPVLEQGAKIYQGYHDEEPSFNASLQSPMFIFGDHTCVMHLSTVPFDISKNTLVLKGKGFNTYWTFFALKGKQKFQEYKRHWSDLKVKQVVIPDENNGLLLTKYFAVKCEGLFGLLEQNRKQNLILQNIRDTLLPKLLSGEIPLPEAEQAVSEVENV